MSFGSNTATRMDQLVAAKGAVHSPVDGRPTPPDITRKDLRWQIWNDVATKEVQTSPTYSYQWMADHVGHMAIGMAAVLLGWPFGGIWPFIGFIVVVVLASLLELFDYRQACKKIRRPFDAVTDKKDLRDNALIAVYYIELGAFFALSALTLNKLPTSLPVFVRFMLLIFVFAVLIGYPVSYWLRQKITFQQIGLPFLFRPPEFRLHNLDFKDPDDEAKKMDEDRKMDL